MHAILHDAYTVVECCSFPFTHECCLTGDMAQSFTLIIVDTALTTTLQNRGPQAWCMSDDDPGTWKQHLAYLVAWMSPSLIRSVEACFKLTEASAAPDVCPS